ncbi:phage tail protein I [Neisseria brasiliensis]|uniref:phage tail protein I n=1 Tax=Neisseria TaxID=482 RepID=UPI000C27BB84|nr:MULTISPECIES: phage tail protein I [Neisseria]PJO78740.1 phage tail protein I [Neisseria sp. N177_16]QGL24215.1 phage tail protein I [Neisseria brasiliensis]
MNSVIPSNNTPLQHTLARLTEDRIAALDWRVILNAHDPAVCQAEWLPWLAWENSISDAEGWRFAQTEEEKRRLIANYIEKHQKKGTAAVIRNLFRDLGLGEIEIIEKVARLRWNGKAVFNGQYIFGGQPEDWAKYAIILKRVISGSQAKLIQAILNEITPIRCELIYIDYRANPLYWNGEIEFNGDFTFGAINNNG